MVQTSVGRKRLKNKQIAISMHHFVIRLPLEPGYLPKRSNLMQNNLLHENTTFMKTFATGFISKLEF